MALPEGFQFSQSSLQDYVDCARRFQLRFVLMQPWPALITQPASEAEEHMRRGADFHHLVHQHRQGLDPKELGAIITDPALRQWWVRYFEQPPPDLPQEVQCPEVAVSAPLLGFRLLAKFDLVAARPGERLVVVDWKTAPRPPSRATLARRTQTRVYRWLAVEAGATFNGGRQPRPDQVEMLYWFAPTGRGECFTYDDELYRADGDYLAELAAEIVARREEVWPLTEERRRCRFCNYRSLCERGVQAGFYQELEEDLDAPEIELTLEQVAEIEF